MLQDGPLLAKPNKKTHIRSKERSKSLIYDRKAGEPSAQPSSRLALMEILQKKIDKADTDISAHLNSVKHDRQAFNIDNIYSNFLSPHSQQRSFSGLHKLDSDATPKLRLLQEENETLRTNLSVIQEEIKTHINENEAARQ
jgi:chromosome segregation ATPase